MPGEPTEPSKSPLSPEAQASENRSRELGAELKAIKRDKGIEEEKPTGIQDARARHGLKGLLDLTADYKPGDRLPEYTPDLQKPENLAKAHDYADTVASGKLRNRLDYLRERGQVGVLSEGTPRKDTSERLHNADLEPEAVRLASAVARNRAKPIIDNMGSDSLHFSNGLRDFPYQEKIRDPKPDQGPTYQPKNTEAYEKEFERQHGFLKDTVDGARRGAIELYERDPERFKNMPTGEFVRVYEQYTEDKADMDRQERLLQETIHKVNITKEYGIQGRSAADVLRYVQRAAQDVGVENGLEDLDKTPRQQYMELVERAKAHAESEAERVAQAKAQFDTKWNAPAPPPATEVKDENPSRWSLV